MDQERNDKDYNKVRNAWRPNPKQLEFLQIPHTIKEAAYLGGAGSGKLLTLNTLIMCPEGLREIQHIHKGDYVIGRDGLPKLVIAETEAHFDEQLYKLTFVNGEVIYCGSNHLWTTWNSKDRSSKTEKARENRRNARPQYIGMRHYIVGGRRTGMNSRPDVAEMARQNRAEPYKGKVRSTQELFETQLDRRNSPNHAIEVCSPIQLEEKQLPIHPYILGCWLGDGTSANGNMTIGQEDFMSFMFSFNEHGFNLIPNATNGKNFRADGLHSLLSKNNLINNKHIPEIYFLGSETQRRELLQGLLDTDGHCYPKTGQVEFCNTNLNLIEGVYKLASSLGIKPKISLAWHSGKEEHKQAYHVKWINPYPVFKLTRKLNNLPKELTTISRFHYIEKIEKVDNQLGKCIQVEDKEYLVGAGCIPTHNSDVLLFFGIVNRWHEIPQWKQVFTRRTYPELKNEILGRSREIYSKFGATFNKTDMIWTFPRPDQYGSGGMSTNAGAQIFLGHLEHDDDVHNYDSMQIPLFTPDEITSYTEWQYLYIAFERNRSPVGLGIPSITRCAGMPGGVGHTWVKKRFIDPYKPGGKVIQGKGGNKRIFIHATFVDNQEHIDPTYGQSLDGRPEAEKRAKKFGDFDAYLGQVFDEFREKHYPDEPDNAIHVIEPFDIPDWWPRFVIIDWGFRANNWVGFFAVSPNKRLFLYRELVWTKTKIAEWGPIVGQFISREKPKKIKVCKSAGQDRGQDHTILSEIEREIGASAELTLNVSGSRVAGKMLFHEYLRWTQKPQPKKNEMPEFSMEYAMRLYRLEGEEAYKNYYKLFEPPEIEDNLPKYQIFCCSESDHEGHPNCCPNAIDAIKACNYAENKGDKVAEDVAEFQGDDAYDGQRYAIDTAEMYFEEAKTEFDKFKKQSDLEQRLRESGNWTAFYRSAEKMHESTNRLIIAPVFSRRRH